MVNRIVYILKYLFLVPVYFLLKLKRDVSNIDINKLSNSRILIISGSGIGNSIMAVPLILTIKKNLPACSIDVLVTNSASGKILEKLTDVDNVYIFANFRVIHKMKYLRNRKYYLSIIAFPTRKLDIELVPLFAGINKIISHDYSNAHPFFKMFMHGLITVTLNEDLHDVDQNLNLFDTLPIHGEKIREYPKIDYINTTCIKKFFNEHSISSDRNLVAIHPGSKHNADYKRWPLESFLEVADKIIKIGILPFFIIGPDEAEIYKRIKETAFPVLREKDFNCVISVLSKSKLLITNDSGIMHLADLLNIPIVSIWGGSDFKRNGAVGKNVVNVYNPAIKCRPCLRFYKTRDCPGEQYECLYSISTEQVFSQVETQLKKLDLIK
ncbi:glycosyltransferase family 9 protein [bacterium]|nr:glycosyltransferase family 9 protein [bacterium]